MCKPGRYALVTPNPVSTSRSAASHDTSAARSGVDRPTLARIPDLRRPDCWTFERCLFPLACEDRDSESRDAVAETTCGGEVMVCYTRGVVTAASLGASLESVCKSSASRCPRRSNFEFQNRHGKTAGDPSRFPAGVSGQERGCGRRNSPSSSSSSSLLLLLLVLFLVLIHLGLSCNRPNASVPAG